MNQKFVVLLAVCSVLSVWGAVKHRNSPNRHSTETQSVSTPSRVSSRTTSSFSCFRDKTWVTGSGKVTQILDDDLVPPCHQRFRLSDESGRNILIVHNIDTCERIPDLSIGDVIAFKGEFLRTAQEDLVHWTHPGNSPYKPGGWLKKLTTSEPSVAAEVVQESPKEYFAGRGPIHLRVAAPVNEDWPETGYWLSTNSGARHNPRCENYRKTRGYPCKKSDGRPCGKCGG